MVMMLSGLDSAVKSVAEQLELKNAAIGKEVSLRIRCYGAPYLPQRRCQVLGQGVGEKEPNSILGR